MKKVFLFLSFALLLALPSLVVGQNTGNKVVILGLPGQQTAELSNDVINQVLTLAAPQFGFSFADFLRMYHTCGCITITEVGPGTYLVVYGGIGIQIVIDGCRQTTGNSGASNGSRK
ncbi:MAG: hypothetical protein RLZZ519_1823 [Bacteroidota bacterium]